VRFIAYNGPAVWLVAVGACPERSEGSGLASFLPVQVDGMELSRHDNIVLAAKSRLKARKFHVKVCFING